MYNTDILITAADGKSKKGDGINAALSLMQEVRDFQDKIDKCAEAQAMAENKRKIESFGDHLDSMWSTLRDIAGDTIRGIRSDDVQNDVHNGIQDDAQNVVDRSHSVQTPVRPRM